MKFSPETRGYHKVCDREATKKIVQFLHREKKNVSSCMDVHFKIWRFRNGKFNIFICNFLSVGEEERRQPIQISVWANALLKNHLILLSFEPLFEILTKLISFMKRRSQYKNP